MTRSFLSLSAISMPALIIFLGMMAAGFDFSQPRRPT
jgi:hypothetical protein